MKFIAKHPLHSAVILLAILAGLLVLMLPKHARAEDGFYTTTTNSTTTSSTDAVTGVITTNTSSSVRTPRDLYNTRDDRGPWYNPASTSDIDARYPYDNTNGRNRSDVDAVRSGFDDPRNPWDGRYMNDNPNNPAYSMGAGSNGTVNSMRGSGTDAYRPGNYGTYSVRNR